MMKIWLIQRAEPLPVDDGRQKLMRTGMLAQALVGRGHEVLWWTSSFDHYRKRQRCTEDTFVDVGPGYRICMLSGTGYRKNISFVRLLDQHLVARKFREMSKKEKRPDLIVCSLPSVELSMAAVEYGKPRNVPVVLDARDMWPDLFLDVLPPFFRPLGRIALSGMFADAERACSGATAITGVTEAFVDWGVRKGKRVRLELDKCFPLGHRVEFPEQEDRGEAESFWNGYGIKDRDNGFLICFIGSVSSQFDIGTMIRAVKICNGSGSKVKFVVCGDGDKLEYYRAMASDDENIIFAGWVNAAKLYVLMRKCSMGLAPLPDNRNYLSHINNKVIEYLSAGLPVISSPDKGVLYDLLRESNCGSSYECANEKELAGLIMDLVSDRDRLGKMSSNALELFQERFTAEKVYSAMAEHLEKISQRGTR